MKLSTKARYAIMALLDMMESGNQLPLSLVSISERQNLPLPYLEQIFLKLRKSGLVQSARGAQGGYLFARNPVDITLYDVVVSVDKPLKAKRCNNALIGCQLKGVRCITHDLWAKMDDVIEGFFKTLTLQHVYDREVGNLVFIMQNHQLDVDHLAMGNDFYQQSAQEGCLV
jgi:Rrf2 family iron-sulfur cluster assembly transcriptional regulator